MGTLEGNLALVTGAGRNLGAAIADELARQGAAIIVADVDMSMAVGAAERLVVEGFKAWAEEIDVTDRQALDELLRRTVDQHGHVSIVVDNAGVADMALSMPATLPSRRIGRSRSISRVPSTSPAPFYRASRGHTEMWSTCRQ
jgi:NAD(P)-dependent dehydrogenase (short-subunit alcohol dehydrogenase family)